MNRRDLLRLAAATPFLAPLLPRWTGGSARARTAKPAGLRSRVRPGDSAWPSAAEWEGLKRDVDGRLVKLESPFATGEATGGAAHNEAMRRLANPFYLGDEPALTQTSGWLDAWA